MLLGIVVASPLFTQDLGITDNLPPNKDINNTLIQQLLAKKSKSYSQILSLQSRTAPKGEDIAFNQVSWVSFT
jgi:hypothetical protein